MVPKLRFKEFCGKWEEKKLKEICKMITDGSHNSPKEIESKKGFYMPSVKDMTNNGFDFTTCKVISEKDYKKLVNQGCKPQKGDILIAKDGSILKHVFVVNEEKEIVILSSIAIVRVNKDIINENYLSQYFKLDSFVTKTINQNKTGTGLKRIVLKNFKELKIKYPSLPEQTKIADFLSTVDDKIQNQQDKITHLENIKKGFMQKIFYRKIRFKDDGGEEFPEWEDNILKNYIEIITGYPFDSEKFIEENNNNPIIRIRDLQDNKISLFTTENYDLKYKVYKGDILIGMDGDFYITMWKGIEVGLNQRIMKIRPKKGLIKNNFLYYLLIPLIKHINDITPFTTVKHLSSKDILNLKVKLPCLKEQQKIADFLSSFDEKIYTEKEVLEHLKQLKKGLLQQMFV